MGKSLRNKIEVLVYDAIEDIADELEIDFEIYPEVYYAHKSFSFNRLGISEIERDNFNSVKRNRGGIYFYKPKIIILANQNTADIYEEAGHFLHFTQSNLNFNGKSDKDILFMNTIIEAIGYFCSKLGDSSRIPPLNKYPDFFKEKEECLKIIDSKNFNKNSFFMYQQGYSIGEKLFNYYISGIVSKERIRSLISEKFKNKYDATYTFIGLKFFFEKFYGSIDHQN